MRSSLVARYAAMVGAAVLLAACGGGTGETASGDSGAAKADSGEAKAASAAPEMPELAAVRAGEAKVLEEYRWVDRSGGVAAIPIERAMRLLVERGTLQARPDSGSAGKPASPR